MLNQVRVLIIGKANAGKTTLLPKLFDQETPTVRDRSGNVIINPSGLTPSDDRGVHDIENEITFSSRPDLVFHDSLGFEAASTTEIEEVRDFISSRAAMPVEKQLSVIWFCLPTSDPRPLCEAEMSFFEIGVAPIIPIFTKYDALEIVTRSRLIEDGLSRSEARKKTPEEADRLLEMYWKSPIKAKYQPTTFVYLRDLDKPKGSIEELKRILPPAQQFSSEGRLRFPVPGVDQV
ncbi:hypothetical protein FRB94_012031 [Tulasnella sp. JGI-2019a]|nr:hypothetical protein FRB94_012031 [Tulasnella sp. JGI-2019a]